jgi:hypothetical protein
MRGLSLFIARCWTLIVPLLILTIATIWMVLTDHAGAARLVSNLGVLWILLFNVGYVVLYDPMGHWKGIPYGERLRRLLTFRL